MAHEHPGTSADQELLDGRYKLLKTINEGSYAKVKLAAHLPTGTPVAIQIVTLRDSANLHRHLMREIQCMKVLQHPNIVQLYKVIETEFSLFLVMKYLGGGSMMDYLIAHGRMKEKEARIIFRKLLSAVYYFHQRGFAHWDIKPQNILFDCNRNPKIADFGLTMEFTDNQLTTRCGTPSYAAPELFRGEAYEELAVDVWSLGVTLYRMVAGTVPFKALSWKKLVQQIIWGKYTVSYFFWFELETLLQKMLKVNPMERKDLLNIMSDPWIHQDEGALIPYREPVNDNIGPWARWRLASLGIGCEDIQDSLNNKADYLMLQREKSKFHPRLSHIKAYNPTEQSPAPGREEQPGTSTMPPVEQYNDDYELGQRGKKPVAPPALQKVKVVTSEPITEPTPLTLGHPPSPRTISPKSILKHSPVSVEPSQELRAATPGHILGRGTISAEVSPEFRPASHKLRPWWKRKTPIEGFNSSSSEDSSDINYSTSTTSIGSSPETCHGWRRVAMSCHNCLTMFCYTLSKKRQSSRNKSSPFRYTKMLYAIVN